MSVELAQVHDRAHLLEERIDVVKREAEESLKNLNSEHEGQIDELTEKHGSELNGRDAHISSLQQEIDDLRLKLDEVTLALDDVKEKAPEDDTSHTETVSLQQSDMDDKISTLEEAHRVEIESLKNEIDRLSSELTALNDANESESRLAEEALIKAKQEAAEAAADQEERWRSVVEEANANVNDLSNEATRSKKEAEEAVSALSSVRSELADISSRLDTQTYEYDKTLRELRAARDEVSELSTKLAQQQSAAQTSRSLEVVEPDELPDECMSPDRAAGRTAPANKEEVVPEEDLLAKLEAITEQLAQSEEAKEKLVCDYTCRLQQLMIEIDAASTALDARTSLLKQKDSLLVDLMDQVAALEGQCAEANGLASSRHAELEEATETITELEAQKENLSMQLQLTVLERGSLIEKATACETEKQNLAAELSHANEVADNLRGELEYVQYEMAGDRLFRSISRFGAVTGFLIAVIAHFHWDIVAQNVACAPAMPGTILTRMDASLEAPWWAPGPLKEKSFQYVCPNRMQTHLSFSTLSGGKASLFRVNHTETEQIWRKSTSHVEVTLDKILLTDKKDEVVELVAPWCEDY